MNVERTLKRARRHAKNGDINDAITLYSNILQVFPLHKRAKKELFALQNITQQKPYVKLTQSQLGSIEALYNKGEYREALKYTDKLSVQNLESSILYNIRGVCYQELGLFNDAINSYKQGLTIEPNNAEVYYNLGNAYKKLSQLSMAVTAYQQALEIQPNYIDAHNNLGNAFNALGFHKKAIECFENALKLNSEFATAHNNLGITLNAIGQQEIAIKSYKRALEINPDYVDCYNNLGNALRDLEQFDSAISCYKKALEINPNSVGVYNNYGSTLQYQGRFDEAITCYKQALNIKPDLVESYDNLGNVLRDLGRINEAIKCYTKALEIKPDYVAAHNNLLFCLNYHPDLSAEAIFKSYQAYDRQFGQPYQAQWQEFTNLKVPDKCLKIGYVSGDFKAHSMGYFLEPILANYDHRQFEITAYAETLKEDSFTQRFQGMVDHWVKTTGMTDEALAACIREDGIDILVDLAGHTAKNRLGVFARKPAPISISMLGYGYSTGLTAIDYFLADSQLVPEGSEHLFSETPWRLESPFFCYRPAEGMGAVSSLPAKTTGQITFGTLTRSVRINRRTIRVWASILKRVAGSRLMINSASFRDHHSRQTILERFIAEGIQAEQLDIAYSSPPWDVIRSMDISLDCFPHNSGTTLLESLYLGVPFITLADRPSVGRIGSSVLESVGHAEWIARNEEEYVEKAVALANDLDTLAMIRSQLRSQMESLPVMDEVGFARKLETAYRQMWNLWCSQQNLKNKTSSTPVLTQAEIDKVFLLCSKGQIKEALLASEQLILQYKDEPVPYSLRGDCYQLLGQCDDAIKYYEEALKIKPDCAEAYNKIGMALNDQRNFDEAIKYFEQALNINPEFVEVYNNLGNLFKQNGQLNVAIENYKRALDINPDYASAYCNLGVILTESRQLDAAIKNYKRALDINPDSGVTHNNLGSAYNDLGQFDAAIKCYKKALALNPSYASAHNNLGTALRNLGDIDAAIICYKRALEINPGLVSAHNNLGLALKDLGHIDEAIISYENALRIKPNYEVALNNYGTALRDLGRLDDAIFNYERAIEIRCDYIDAYNNLLFCLNYHPDKNAETIFEAYKVYDKQFGQPYRQQWQDFNNSKISDRRLKIAYVSGDFRTHSLRHFLEPILSAHDHQCFEITAYAELIKEDEFSCRYQGLVDHWVVTMGMSDEMLAEKIREDEIDILIDLAGHTARNRLGVFARKPAPVSISMLGYGYTTGLKAVDYFLCDSQLVPEGSEHLFSEKPWRLPDAYFCYRPAEGMGDVSPLPAQKTGYITFGTLTRIVRVNYRTIRVWADILKRVVGSKLIINSFSFAEISSQQMMIKRFAVEGIEAERLLIGYNSPPWDLLRDIDIGLDCFPHNSGTTLLENLYMGVPFITLADRPSVGRIGACVLESVGHSEWIANNEEEYIEKAVKLSADLDELSDIRSRLRTRMESLPVMDQTGFVVKLETAYRQMWSLWCGEQKQVNEFSPSRHPLTQAQIDSILHLYSKGQIKQALEAAEKLLTHYPDEWVLLNICGGCFQSLGLFDKAVNCYERELKINPNSEIAYLNLGNIKKRESQYDKAIKYYEKALGIKSDYIEALYNLANTFNITGQIDVAIKYYQLALKINPEYVDALCNLGNVFNSQGQFEVAIQYYQKVLNIRPDFAEMYFNCANCYFDLRQLERAIESYKQALKIKPDYVLAYNNLGNTYSDLYQLNEAVETYSQALFFDPNNAEAHNNLGLTLVKLRQFVSAIKSFKRALKVKPDYAEAHCNLGSANKDLGLLDEAIISFKKALEIQPDYAMAFGNLLFCINYHPDLSAATIFEYYQAYDKLFGLPNRGDSLSFNNSKLPSKRLKIGYVSGDFKEHSMRYFLEPILSWHNHQCFEIIAYAELNQEDEFSGRYQGLVDHWVRTAGMSDDEFASQIRKDKIDILIDLAGHTANNRLGVFARKPAPVSISMFGYGYTTGLSAIDYFFGDELLLPIGSEQLFSERLWRLKSPWFCYRPAEGMGEVNSLPALTKGYVTFGTLSRSVRINHRTVRVWSEILKRVEGSRLIINSRYFSDYGSQQVMLEHFVSEGISAERLMIGYDSPPWDLLRKMDIGFDCFPHNSGTTLFENIYMGVPFITLADRPSVGRIGASILGSVRHSEWIAMNEDEYIEKAVTLANDLDRLAVIRSQLRGQMEGLAIMDEAGFVNKLETAYRQMWQQWCEQEN